MAYWWVYQGKSFERSFAGGYMWAPHRTQKDRTPYYYWSNLKKVQLGDLIFSHVEKELVAVSTPLRLSYDSLPPDVRDNADWSGMGWKLDVDYQLLKTPLSYAEAYAAISNLIGGPESPFATNGRPNQGYLFKLPDVAGAALAEVIDQRGYSSIFDAFGPSSTGPMSPPNTTGLSIVQTRIGQDVFRKRLETLWNFECSVSGVKHRDLLRASHIKPWSIADNFERLDRYNGLLLSAAYDAAFDTGLISFSDDGRLILSSALSPEEAVRAGLNTAARLRFVDPPHRAYLAVHRELYQVGLRA